MIYLNLLYRAFNIQDNDKSFVRQSISYLITNQYISSLDIYNTTKINLYNNTNIDTFAKKNSNLTLDKLLLFCNPVLVSHVVNPNKKFIHKTGLMYNKDNNTKSITSVLNTKSITSVLNTKSITSVLNHIKAIEIYYIKTNE